MKKNILSLFFNYLGPHTSLILSFLITPLLIFNYSIEDWSYFGMFTLLQTISTLLIYGKEHTINREATKLLIKTSNSASSAKKVLEIESSIYLKFIFLTIILFILLNIIFSNERNINNFLPLLFLISVNVSLKLFEILYTKFLNGLKEHIYLNSILSIMSVLKWGGVLIIADVINANIFYCFLWIALISVFMIVLLRVKANKYVQFIFDIKQIFKLKKFNFSNHNSNIFFSIILFSQVDKLPLISNLSREQISIYSLAIISASLLKIFSIPLINFYKPNYNENFIINIKGKLNYFIRSSIYLFFFNIFIFLILFFFINEFLEIWLGNTVYISEIVIFFKPLLAGFFFYVCLMTIRDYLNATGELIILKNLIYFSLVIFFLISFLILINKINLITFLYSWSILLGFIVLISYLLLIKLNKK